MIHLQCSFLKILIRTNLLYLFYIYNYILLVFELQGFLFKFLINKILIKKLVNRENIVFVEFYPENSFFNYFRDNNLFSFFLFSVIFAVLCVPKSSEKMKILLRYWTVCNVFFRLIYLFIALYILFPSYEYFIIF